MGAPEQSKQSKSQVETPHCCHSYDDSKVPAFNTDGCHPMSFDSDSDFEPVPFGHPDIYFDRLRVPLEICFVGGRVDEFNFL